MTNAEFLAIIPWKDWGVPIIAALCSVVGMALKEYYSKRSRADRAAQRAEERKETLSVRLEQSQGAEITARFRQIMDGYESRIEDLMRELLGCREEIKDLRQAFDKHKDRCRGCPYVSGLEAADGTA